MLALSMMAISARAMYIMMLVILAVVMILFALILVIALKPVKKPPEAVDPNNVRTMLARRESDLTVQLMRTKDNEEARNDLLNKLRRVKSAQALIEEMIDEENRIMAEVNQNDISKLRKKVADKEGTVRPAPQGRPGPNGRPVPQGRPGPNGRPMPQGRPGPNGRPAPQGRPAPVKKKKDDLEFAPSIGEPSAPAAQQAPAPAPAPQAPAQPEEKKEN